MKVWELEEGKEYVSNLPKQERFIYKIIDGYLHRKEEGIYYKDYTDYNFVKDVDFTEYIPPTDWSKVEVDVKVLVRDKNNKSWILGHFAKYDGKKCYTWMGGQTSSTENKTLCWNQAKLYIE